MATSNAKKIEPRPLVSHYEELSKLLYERRNEVLARGQADREQVDQQLEAAAGPGDVGDSSIADANSDYFRNMADQYRAELDEIDAALDRMNRGTYGNCENCDEEMPLDRLRKLPQARRCIDCQSRTESVRLAPLHKRFPTL